MKPLNFITALSFFTVVVHAGENPVADMERNDTPAAFLGISMDNSRGDGVRVDYVQPGSPAAKAGLERGAIIFGICGMPVKGVMAQVSEVIGVKKPGDEIELRWCLNETVHISRITLGSRTKADRAAEARERDQFVGERKLAIKRGVQETVKRIDALSISLETGSEKRARLEEQVRKLEKEARSLQDRAADLREELRRFSE